MFSLSTILRLGLQLPKGDAFSFNILRLGL
jgi:hypothetical protein